MIKQITGFLKRQIMLVLSLSAALIGLLITPPSKALFSHIDFRTLGVLFMVLCVLEGIKKENLLFPVVRLSSRFHTMRSLTLFLVFGVFFLSMFVTNDVSLLIFVPLTILLFQRAGRENRILPVLALQNIAAIRGSMLTPFGSPQNLFLYGHANISPWRFVLHMLPLSLLSALLLIAFIFLLYRKDNEVILPMTEPVHTEPIRTPRRIVFSLLFVLVLLIIVTRTNLWHYGLIAVLVTIFIADRRLFLQVDYVLIITFFCFFVFSSCIVQSPAIASFLKEKVAGNEYIWSIGLSQIISNVPASIVLYPFSENFAGLIYGLDTAGLCTIIGSLASVINYRLYVRAYQGKGKEFLKTFTLISLAFFFIVVLPGYLLSFWDFS